MGLWGFRSSRPHPHWLCPGEEGYRWILEHHPVSPPRTPSSPTSAAWASLSLAREPALLSALKWGSWFFTRLPLHKKITTVHGPEPQETAGHSPCPTHSTLGSLAVGSTGPQPKCRRSLALVLLSLQAWAWLQWPRAQPVWPQTVWTAATLYCQPSADAEAGLDSPPGPGPLRNVQRGQAGAGCKCLRQ